MKIIILSLLSGVIFGLGLSLSQMTNPDKVLNFLDIAGNWDPSLIFVMLGALLVTLTSFRLIFGQSRPVFDTQFHVTTNREIDKPLIVGAAIFGIGWGIAGYCPGPVIAGLGNGNVESIILIIAIYVGFFLHRYFFDRH